MRSFEEAFEQKDPTVDCDFDDAVVNSSPGYLEIVWNNLFSDAVKFTREGGIFRFSSAGTGAAVRAEDGCGISPETGGHIFA